MIDILMMGHLVLVGYFLIIMKVEKISLKVKEVKTQFMIH
tara:strand:- start:371 stop:490 length:120 start_codon:yes stop_codon:yes gene_type:complete